MPLRCPTDTSCRGRTGHSYKGDQTNKYSSGHAQPSSARPVSNYCGAAEVTSSVDTAPWAGPGWTTHRAQGQLRSTAPAPTRDQNSFHKLSHHGEYLRLYLYISTLISIYLCSVCCCCGGLGGDIAATCVSIPANIPQPDTRQTARVVVQLRRSAHWRHSTIC